jgi:hypothetical protein
MFKACIHKQEKPSERSQMRSSSHLNNNRRRKEEGIVGKKKGTWEI